MKSFISEIFSEKNKIGFSILAQLFDIETLWKIVFKVINSNPPKKFASLPEK